MRNYNCMFRTIRGMYYIQVANVSENLIEFFIFMKYIVVRAIMKN